MKEADDKTLRVELSVGDFSGLLLPRFSQLPLLAFLQRTILGMRFAGSLAILVAALTFTPMSFAQADKPSENAKAQDKATSLSHDLSGVWMQYPDGDVPGTPGMNGVNEHFRPPLTPWGQAQLDAAKPLSGGEGRCRQGGQFRLALRAERPSANSHPSQSVGDRPDSGQGVDVLRGATHLARPSGRMDGRSPKIPTRAISGTRLVTGKATHSLSRRLVSTTRSGSTCTGIRGLQRRA